MPRAPTVYFIIVQIKSTVKLLVQHLFGAAFLWIFFYRIMHKVGLFLDELRCISSK